MKMFRILLACLTMAGAAAGPLWAFGFDTASDEALAAAQKYVESSGRYLHHSKLQRGDKGYGLTVFAGNEIVKFDAEIVSVMTNWGPHQDVILARLAGHGLDKSGVIAGMSGSPVFMKDPADGKFKMIGAVAFGWSAPKEPLCGIQPITQMLVMSGLPGKGPAPVGRNESHATAGKVSTAAANTPGTLSASGKEFLQAMLDPRKRDFSEVMADKFSAASAPAGEALSAGLAPLTIPVTVRGMGARTLETLRGPSLRKAGIMPVEAGGAGFADPKVRCQTCLEPGSAIGVALVSGDADMSAVGTVTDVMGDRVLAFGHQFFAQGDVSFPMGTAYVHTVIPSVIRSVKLASLLEVKGLLDRDQSVGVGGLVGKTAATIPMTVIVENKSDNRKQLFRYRLCRDRLLTGMLARTLVENAAIGWKDVPPFHTVRHVVKIDFGDLGTYEARNTLSQESCGGLISDLTRPLLLMMNSPLGEPPAIKQIDVQVCIEPQAAAARLVELKLDANLYKPGQTVTGKLVLRPFRQEECSLPVSLKLPKELPDGAYTLTACDFLESLMAQRREMPQRFDPQDLKGVLAACQGVVAPQADQLVLRLPLRRGGLSLAGQELPDLPASRAGLLAQSRRDDLHAFVQTLTQSVPAGYCLQGSVSADFRVQAVSNELPLRKQD